MLSDNKEITASSLCDVVETAKWKNKHLIDDLNRYEREYAKNVLLPSVLAGIKKAVDDGLEKKLPITSVTLDGISDFEIRYGLDFPTNGKIEIRDANGEFIDLIDRSSGEYVILDRMSKTSKENCNVPLYNLKNRTTVLVKDEYGTTFTKRIKRWFLKSLFDNAVIPEHILYLYDELAARGFTVGFIATVFRSAPSFGNGWHYRAESVSLKIEWCNE